MGHELNLWHPIGSSLIYKRHLRKCHLSLLTFLLTLLKFRIMYPNTAHLPYSPLIPAMPPYKRKQIKVSKKVNKRKTKNKTKPRSIRHALQCIHEDISKIYKLKVVYLSG